jgi:hypothetical protein
MPRSIAGGDHSKIERVRIDKAGTDVGYLYCKLNKFDDARVQSARFQSKAADFTDHADPEKIRVIRESAASSLIR